MRVEQRALWCSAVLFDLDGVLVDSMHVVRKLWRLWAEERGLEPGVLSAASKGGPGIETLRILDPTIDAEAEAERLSDLEHSFVDEVTPMAGAVPLLSALSGARVPWGIVTSGTTKVARGRIEHCGLPDPPVLVTANDVRRGKPDPEPYLTGADRLGVSISRCVVVEDSPGGIRSGRAAGATVVGVLGSHPPARLVDAHHLINSPEGLQLSSREPGNTSTVPFEDFHLTCRRLSHPTGTG